jgi:serine/threonine-protein phosphatase 4 regulatory subunit 4
VALRHGRAARPPDAGAGWAPLAPLLRLQVRTAALPALLGVIAHVAPEARRSRVVPALRQHMQPLELDPAMQRCVARHFPQLLAAMGPEMGPEDVGRSFGCYRHLAARQDPELRR